MLGNSDEITENIWHLTRTAKYFNIEARKSKTHEQRNVVFFETRTLQALKSGILYLKKCGTLEFGFGRHHVLKFANASVNFKLDFF